MINITLKDGTVKTYESGITVFDVAKDISSGLARVTLAGELNGELVDIRKPILEDSTLSLLTFDDEGGKHAFWHTGSHLLAQAVKRLYPQAKLAIGPAIDHGFYYDIDVDVIITPEIMEKIEKEMAKLVKEGLAIERSELSRADALEKVKNEGEFYKEELIQNLPEDAIISFYSQGEFSDLCAGPHINNLSPIKAIKLLSLAGAYWHGDEKNKMLQRIYGITFPKKSQLTEYLERIEEAKKRDHRKLGKELDLFSIQEEGPGFPFFHPKGMVIRNELESFWRQEHQRRGYQEIKTPIILNAELWKRSGHWDHYKENMYFTEIDESDYAIKPMNCPGGMLVYKRKGHSYRDLPLKMGELGLVHRHELHGALHGLMRVRAFTQDDAHIFMTPEQIKEEVIKVINLADDIYKVFGFNYRVELSTKPEKAIGSDEVWEMATEALRDALVTKEIDYRLNPGDGAFYGPKIDFHLEDSLGRTWQCGTIQLDFQMPERFDLNYIGSDGEKHRPVIIHRTILGSIERFFGILIEHFAGKFPVWLAPVQVMIIPVADVHHDFAKGIADELMDIGVRASVDVRDEKLGYRIRDAQMQKIPYMLVVGDKEAEGGDLALRMRDTGDAGLISLEDLKEKLIEKIKTRSLTLD
ncbi:threonine--tRNA ligase [Acetobacterium bakii]|uniref:Threonine--tRNA ligase n=1 Tax=Acetobacterium bakii TaxID=52689 RepID=A0A0L6TXK0_9FIRM|nr:threonine--tRNA ligase [Acetobacterium bakii]KNZ40978.1 threonyl-tRNA synthetase [Acetobacterium bakii]